MMAYASWWMRCRWASSLKLSAYSLYTASVPDGRAANQPWSVTTLMPPIGRWSPAAVVSSARIGSPASAVTPTSAGVRRASAAFCCRRRRDVDAGVERLTDLGHEGRVLLARVTAGAGHRLDREEPHDQAVLVRGPDGTIPAEERRAGALLARRAEGAVEQAVDEVLEPHRHLDQPPAEARGHAVDEAARHDGLGHRGVASPAWPMTEEVPDGRRQVVVRIEKATRAAHDPESVRVRVVGDHEVEPIAKLDRPRHGIRGGRVHADRAVTVDRHETKGRVDRAVHDGQLNAVPPAHALPVSQAGASEGVDADAESRPLEHLYVDHVPEIVDVAGQEIEAMHGHRPPRPLPGDPDYAPQPVSEELVGLVLDPVGHGSVGRATGGRVVLDAAVLRRVVRRRDHDAIREPRRAATVVREDRLRDHGRRGDVVVVVDHDLDAVGREHLQRAHPGRLRQGVSVPAKEERAVDPMCPAVETDRLDDRQDVRLVEARLERRAPVPGGPEGYALRRHRGIRPLRGVRGDEPRYVNQERLRRRLTRQWVDRVRAWAVGPRRYCARMGGNVAHRAWLRLSANRARRSSRSLASACRRMKPPIFLSNSKRSR